MTSKTSKTRATRRTSGAGDGLLASTLPRPLAETLRPTTLGEVLGQDALLGSAGTLTRLLESGHLGSLIFWGPPGSGKTTIAKLLAEQVSYAFVQVSAVFSGVKELREIFAEAGEHRKGGQETLLFVDEIHRFNRAQQDGFLPFVEDGTITLVGATTENPSFELNGALLSRCRVLTLARLEAESLKTLLQRAEAHLGRGLPVTDSAREQLLDLADGDGRYLLNLAEALFALPETDPALDSKALAQFAQKRAPLYDKSREEHYNLISALHKSIRGSDPDAALYWFSRMLDGGEDPRYIARRLTRIAVEDIGLAQPQALGYAIAAWETYERLGTPEGELALANLVLLLACAPKSIAGYRAFNEAMKSAGESGSLAPPKHSLNAPTRLMKDLGYSKGYVYDPDTESGFSGQNYFPEAMERRKFYRPKGDGTEAEIKKRLEAWDKQRQEKAKQNNQN